MWGKQNKGSCAAAGQVSVASSKLESKPLTLLSWLRCRENRHPMHPFLSWSILLIVVASGYIATKGLPAFLQVKLSKRAATRSSPKKSRKRRERKNRPVRSDQLLSQSQSGEQSAAPKGSQGATQPNPRQERAEPAPKKEDSKPDSGEPAAPFNAVAHVMNGYGTPLVCQAS